MVSDSGRQLAGGAGGGGTAGAACDQSVQVRAGAELAGPCPGFNQQPFVPGTVPGAVDATVKSLSLGLLRAQSGLGETGTRKAQCIPEGGNPKCAMAT